MKHPIKPNPSVGMVQNRYWQQPARSQVTNLTAEGLMGAMEKVWGACGTTPPPQFIVAHNSFHRSYVRAILGGGGPLRRGGGVRGRKFALKRQIKALSPALKG